jgi:hypothetical protein
MTELNAGQRAELPRQRFFNEACGRQRSSVVAKSCDHLHTHW